jgi:hypothetical protein
MHAALVSFSGLVQMIFPHFFNSLGTTQAIDLTKICSCSSMASLVPDQPRHRSFYLQVIGFYAYFFFS